MDKTVIHCWAELQTNKQNRFHIKAINNSNANYSLEFPLCKHD